MALRASLRLWLCCYAALLLTTILSVSSALAACNSHSGDALLDRVDLHLSSCLPSHSLALDAFKDALNANELEAQAPLALVAFSSSSSQLTRLAVAVATAAADVSPAVRVIDFTALLRGSSQPNHALRQSLRSEVASTLRACAPRRTVFVVRGLEAVRGDRLPLLDVFLDPMNGARALLHDQLTGRDLDCRRALFVFLYRQEHGDSALTKSSWRDFLVGKWSADATRETDKFTPQALVGRLSVAVQLQAEEGEEEEKAAIPALCDWDGYLTRLGVARREEQEAAAKEEEKQKEEAADATSGRAGPEVLGESPWSSVRGSATAFGVLLLVVALLVAAKQFVMTSKEKEEVVLIQKATRQLRSRGASRPTEDHSDVHSTATTYSLRSRTVVASASAEESEAAESGAGPRTTKSISTPPQPRKPTPMKRSASARTTTTTHAKAAVENERDTDIVAPPPTPATPASPPGKSPGKRRARRATRS